MAENKSYKDLVFDRSGYTGTARAEVEAYDRALIRELKRCGAKETRFSGRILGPFSFASVQQPGIPSLKSVATPRQFAALHQSGHCL